MGSVGKGGARAQTSGRGPDLKGGPKDRPVCRQPNPCSLAAWAGWLRFSAFDANPDALLADVCSHDRMVAALSKRDLSQACVWLSLAAHMRQKRYEHVFGALASRHWAEVGVEQLYGVLNEWCRKAAARWVLYELSPGETGSRVLQQVSSSSPAGALTRDSWSFLRLGSDVGFHLVPLGEPSDVIMPNDILFPPPPCPSAPITAPVPAVETVVVEVVKAPSPEVEPDWVVEDRPATPEPVKRRAGAFHEGTLRYEGIFPPPQDHVVVAGEAVWPTLRSFWSGRRLMAGHPVAYSWMAGWWESEGLDARASYWRRSPVLVAATVDMFARYGGSVLYYLPSSHRFTPVGRRGLTDGVRRATFFTAGDSLNRDGVGWVAVNTRVCGLQLLVVRRTSECGSLRAVTESVSAAFEAPDLVRDLLGAGPPSATVRAPCNERLPSVVTDKMAYDIARMRAPESHQPLIQRGWVEWQAQQGGEGAPKAEVVCNYAAGLMANADSQPFSYAGGKSFEWGYCYSCGRQLPGQRMPGRLCGCAPTPAARVYADGGRIAKLGGVTYPGVVTTQSRHPPLKSGKETLATGQVFRVPPLAVRH